MTNAEVKAIYQKWKPLVYKTFLPSNAIYPVEFFVVFKNATDRTAALDHDIDPQTRDLFDVIRPDENTFLNIEKIVQSRCTGQAVLFDRVGFELPRGYTSYPLDQSQGGYQVNGKSNHVRWRKLKFEFQYRKVEYGKMIYPRNIV